MEPEFLLVKLGRILRVAKKKAVFQQDDSLRSQFQARVICVELMREDEKIHVEIMFDGGLKRLTVSSIREVAVSAGLATRSSTLNGMPMNEAMPEGITNVKPDDVVTHSSWTSEVSATTPAQGKPNHRHIEQQNNR